MSPLTCPRCRRTNPLGAHFCYFDGQILRPAMGPSVDPAVLPREFVFASGRHCRTWDDFVAGCREEWEGSRGLLQSGAFAAYLDGIGRPDLGRAARETQNMSDADAALHEFIECLPAVEVRGPRLDLHPRRLLVATLRAGEQRQLSLVVSNLGQGLLQGKIAVSAGTPWLSLGDEETTSWAIKATKEQEVHVRVDARGLSAGRTHSGKLTIITNGGIAEAPVRLDLGAVPFAWPPYQGSVTPRELAERFRAHPKRAVALLEEGEVARWFQANGWTYPVPGVAAKGVAAVQQFFEFLGLSKPPPLQVSPRDFRCACAGSEVVPGEVVLSTSAKKWVYARADAGVPWLRVLTPIVSGAQQAKIGFEVDPEQFNGEGLHCADLEVTANGGQKLKVAVTAERQHSLPTGGRGWLLTLVKGALIGALVRLFLALPGDVFARLLREHPARPGGLEGWLHPAMMEDNFLQLFVQATWWLGGIVGLVLVWRRMSRPGDLLCGLVAGAAAGLAGAATVGCLLSQVDGAPRALLRQLLPILRGEFGPWSAMGVWVATACVCWAALGAGLGLVVGGLRELARLFWVR